MTKTFSSMTERDQDAALARLVGYVPVLVEQDMGVFTADRCFLDKGDYCYAVDGGILRLPSFTTSLDAMRLVEEVIRERHLELAYVEALMFIVGFGAIGESVSDFWSLLSATPAQRAEAAWRVLSAVEGEHEGLAI